MFRTLKCSLKLAGGAAIADLSPSSLRSVTTVSAGTGLQKLYQELGIREHKPRVMSEDAERVHKMYVFVMAITKL